MSMALLEELLREMKRQQTRITELETKLAQETELKEGRSSGVGDASLVQEVHLGKRVLDSSQANLGESSNDENNKRKIEDLENKLKLLQDKMKDMKSCHAADARMLSEDALAKDESCLIKFENEDSSSLANKWVPPPEGYLKLNVDALNIWVYEGSSFETGVGAVIRDHKGEIYRFMKYNLVRNISDTLLKVTAMREGLRWVKTLRLRVRGLIVETECLFLLEHLALGKEEWSEYGLTVLECGMLLRSLDMDDVVVKRIKTENILARALVVRGRQSLSVSLYHENLQYRTPPYIQSIVDSERPTEFKN